MPLELQRCVSQLREVDMQTQGTLIVDYLLMSVHIALSYSGLYEKIENLRSEFVKAVEEGDGPQQRVCLRRLQESMLEAREAGNTKLQISSQLLDIVCGTKNRMLDSHLRFLYIYRLRGVASYWT